MICWESTVKKLNRGNLDGFRPKVICKCDECEKEQVITIRVKSKVTDNQMEWICPKCVGGRSSIKKKLSESTIRQWEREDYKKERSESSKKLWRDEEYRKNISKKSREYFRDPDVRDRLSEFYSKKYSDLEYREERRRKSTQLWKDKIFREKVAGTANSEILNGKSPSSLHTVFSRHMSDLGITTYESEFQIGPYVFDFVIHREGDRDVLIEINGDYWHHLKPNIERDKRKTSYITNNLSAKYELYAFWEYEFYTKNRILSRLKQILKIEIASIIDFSFDSVDIKEIDAKEARVFLTQYHYSGTLGRGGMNIGAFIDDKLIAVVVYSGVIRKEVAEKQKLKTNEIKEISRFCISPFHHKKNFASWFLSRSIKIIKSKFFGLKMLISFADETYNHHGIIYKATNFELDGMVKPDYAYVDQSGWIMHKKTLYNHARSLRMKESDFASKHNYKKIWGLAKYRYIHRLSR